MKETIISYLKLSIAPALYAGALMIMCNFEVALLASLIGGIGALASIFCFYGAINGCHHK